MQITFRPNHGRPPQKFKSPKEKFDGLETGELELDETLGAKVGFVMEEEQYVAGEQDYQESGWSGCKPEYPGPEKPNCPPENHYPNYPDYPGCKPGCPGHKPGCPDDKPDWPGNKPGCPDNKPDWGGNKPGCPDNKPDWPGNKPGCPDNKPGSACDPYPYPGNYYPLQCLGYAYIPWQTYHRQYQANEALEKGTLFPELYSPYFPERKPPVIPRPYCNMWQCSNMNRNRKG